MSVLVYSGAALAEIAGCFAFWGWLRLEKPLWWLVPGVAFLVLFAYLLTLVESSFAAGPMRPMAGSISPLRSHGSGPWREQGPTAGTRSGPPSAFWVLR